MRRMSQDDTSKVRPTAGLRNHPMASTPWTGHTLVMMKLRSFVSLTVFAAIASILPAQSSRTDPVAIPRAVDSEEADEARELISDLLAFHHKAIELSRIAEAASAIIEIRSFAEATVATNTAAREGLDDVMETTGPVAQTPPANTFDEREWRMKEADEFNEEYVYEMVDVHQELVDLYESAAKSDHAGLAAHAKASITGMKLHLERAKLLDKAQD